MAIHALSYENPNVPQVQPLPFPKMWKIRLPPSAGFFISRVESQNRSCSEGFSPFGWLLRPISWRDPQGLEEMLVAMLRIYLGSICLVGGLLLAVSLPAFGKDLNVLVRILYAAFVAENGAAMCTVPNVQLTDEDRIVFRDARTYAQWVKQRISADLSAEEVQFVLQSAAGRAKGEMDEVVRIIKSYPSNVEYAELSRWCTSNMKPIAFEVVGAYANQREALEKLIDKSKQN